MFTRLKGLFAGTTTSRYNDRLRAFLNPQQRTSLVAALETLAGKDREHTELIWLLEHAALDPHNHSAIDIFMMQRLPELRSGMTRAAADACNPLLPTCLPPSTVAPAQDRGWASTGPRLATLSLQFLGPSEGQVLHEGATRLMGTMDRVLTQETLDDVQSLWVIDAALRRPLNPMPQSVFDMLVGVRGNISKANREAVRLAGLVPNPVLAKRA